MLAHRATLRFLMGRDSSKVLIKRTSPETYKPKPIPASNPMMSSLYVASDVRAREMLTLGVEKRMVGLFLPYHPLPTIGCGLRFLLFFFFDSPVFCQYAAA